MKPLKLYWYDALVEGRKNFGDWLSPLLVGALSKREVVHASPRDCDLVAVGSVLQRVRHHWWNRKLRIWGTGFIAPQAGVPGKHIYCAVRGRRTAAMIDAPVRHFGDPGLLAPLLLPGHAEARKTCRVGIVPHYTERGDPGIAALTYRLRGSRIIDVLREPVAVLNDIAECEFVLSSSLHGLVVADAFGIPNAWLRPSASIKGAAFKFEDYYSVFDMPSPAAETAEALSEARIEELAARYARPGLEERRKALIEVFPYS